MASCKERWHAPQLMLSKSVPSLLPYSGVSSGGLEPGTIKIQSYEGHLANALFWSSAPERSYACTYNGDTGELEMRDGGARGPVLHTFANATPITEVERFFSTL